MPENKFTSELTAFYHRLQGKDRLRKSDGELTILKTPESNQEKATKLKITYLQQYVRNKNYNRKHIEFYDEYRRMVATFPIIKAGVDIYAEEATTKNNEGNVINIKTNNLKVKKLLEECYFKNLKLNSRSYLVVRELCKFGNVFGYLVTRPRVGVTEIVFLPPEAVIREQMVNPENLDEYRFVWYGGGTSKFEPWEIVHWRNVEDLEQEPYGISILRSIVDTWRRVVLIREALVIYRVTRAPAKLLWKIGTDGMTGEEAFRFAQDMKKEVKKKPLVNPETGEIDFKFNPISVEEDIWMPTYEGSPADVTVLEGASNLDAVEDYKIIKDDIFAGLKIPKSWLSFEEDLSNKAALGEEDIRFAKTSSRIQSEFLEGCVHIGLVHLFLNGCSEEEMQSFTLEMANPSTGSEKRKWEIMGIKLDVAAKMWDSSKTGLNLMSYTDVLKTVFKFTQEEIQQTIKSQIAEKKLNWRLNKISTDGFYDEPELDKLLKQELSMTGGVPAEKVDIFNKLGFEGTTFTEIVEKKVERELLEMFGPAPKGTPEKKQIKLIEGTLKRNLDKVGKDLKW